MKRQNRALGFVIVLSLLIMGTILWSSRRVSEGPASPPAGLPATANTAPKSPLAALAKPMAECLQMKASVPEADLTVENLLLFLQTEWGPILRRGDRSLSWNLADPNGREHTYKLVVTESDSGQTIRELYAYEKSATGDWLPRPLPDSISRNPSDEQLNQLLHDGTVVQKIRESSALFTGDQVMDWSEVGEQLSNVEVTSGLAMYSCLDVQQLQTCNCAR